MKNLILCLFLVPSLLIAFQFNNKAYAQCAVVCNNKYCLLNFPVTNPTFGSLVPNSQYCYCLNDNQFQCGITQFSGNCLTAATYANSNPNFDFNTCSTPTPTPVPTPDCRALAGGGTGVCAVSPYIGGFYNANTTICSWTDTNTGIVYPGDQKSNGCCCLKPTPTPIPTLTPHNPPISQPPAAPPPTSGYCYPSSNGIDCNNSNGVASGNCGGIKICRRNIGNYCKCE
jgi:hypothetical protein